MKIKLLFTALLTAVSVSPFAQDDSEVRTLFNKGNAKWGGEFTFFGTGASFNDRFYGGGGFECGAIRNHSLEFGIFLEGFGSETHTDYKITFDEKYFIGGGYGGLFIKPIIMPTSPVHFSIPIRIGGGEIGYYSSEHFWDDDDYYYHHHNYYDDDEDECGVFVFEPGFNVDFNMLKHFQITLGVSYRMFGSLSLDYSQNQGEIIGKQDLNGMIYSLGFRFGWF
ncbi:MAG: hypothetical protein IKB95_02850 [Bacteroidales bacterium]|nr:hypothetical protein [Bacteroidales bacterium]